MVDSHWDCIVVGVGGVGGAALAHLAGRGVHVLGLDQFPPGHDRGSSHGQTRIIRQAYFEHSEYVPLLQRAWALWANLEQATGETLYQPTGLLQVGPPEGTVVRGVLESARRHGLAVTPLSPAEVRHRWPGFQIPQDQECVFEERAGILAVERCVLAQHTWALHQGATIRQEQVTGWSSEPARLRVCTPRAAYTADRLVIAAGAWAGQVLADLALPLTVLRKGVFWYPVDPTCSIDRGFPCFLFEQDQGVFYGLPSRAGGPLKVAEHSGGQVVVDPLLVVREVDPAEQQRVEGFLDRNLPLVEHRLEAAGVCLYTMTADCHFLVDLHPADNRVAFAAGLSGHGFKFAPVLGEVLADLALKGATDHAIGFIGRSRFSQA